MAWWNPFKKKETSPQPAAADHTSASSANPIAPPQPPKKEEKPPEPTLPQELADSPLAKCAFQPCPATRP
jgi:hypothetical protein